MIKSDQKKDEPRNIYKEEAHVKTCSSFLERSFYRERKPGSGSFSVYGKDKTDGNGRYRENGKIKMELQRRKVEHVHS